MKFPKWLIKIGILNLCVLPTPAYADIPVAGYYKTGAAVNEFKQSKTTIMSLVRTDRAPRDWKNLKFLPGKETSHFYSVLTPEGNLIVKESDHKISSPKPRDDRPLKERRPNVYICVTIGQWAVSPLVGAAVAVVSAKRN